MAKYAAYYGSVGDFARARDTRTLFSAASDIVAASVAGVVDGVSSAKRSALCVLIQEAAPSSVHPTGTFIRGGVLIGAADDTYTEVQFDNVKSSVSPDALVALVLGVAFAGGGVVLAALSIPPVFNGISSVGGYVDVCLLSGS